MTKERELLRRALEVLDEKVIGYEITKGAIRAYLSTPSDDHTEDMLDMVGQTKLVPVPMEIFDELRKLRIENAEFKKSVSEDIRTYLSTPSDDAEEPVGYAVKMIPKGLHFIGFVGEEETEEEIEDYGPDQIVPLYTRPEPARKPMTSEEMEKQYEIDKEYFGESVMRAFYNGIRFAEKHHDIGGDDE